MKIRTVKAEDLLEVSRIQGVSFGTPWEFEQLVAQYERNKQGFLVAEDKGKVTGFSIADPGGLLMLIAVDAKHRHKGTGSKLLEASMALMKNSKVSKAFVQVREKDLEAIRFYTGNGFNEEKRLSRFYGDENGLLLSKKLA